MSDQLLWESLGKPARKSWCFAFRPLFHVDKCCDTYSLCYNITLIETATLQGGMIWCRTRRRAGSRLALMVLLLQIMLSFGHTHTDPSGEKTAGLVATSLDITGSCRASCDQPAPSPDEHDGDGCAVCATLAMAHSVLAAVPPALPLPQFGLAFERTAERAAQVAARTAAAFQPRAPPAA
jgi:hypothetical protein